MHALSLLLLLGVAVALASGQQINLDRFKGHHCYQLVVQERGEVSKDIFTFCGRALFNVAENVRKEKGKYLLYGCVVNRLGLLRNNRLNTSKLRTILNRTSLPADSKGRYIAALQQCDDRSLDLVRCMDTVCPGLLNRFD